MRRIKWLGIARDGWPFIGVLIAAWLVVHAVYGVLAGLPVIVAIIALAVFFYDPDRSIPPEPLAVVSPVDGRILYWRQCRDPFFDRDAVVIGIRVNWLGAYLLRATTEGTVLELPAAARAGFDGAVSWIRTDEGDDVVLAVPRGAMFGAQPCLACYGERVGQGRRCGARRLARRGEIYLPATCRIDVEEGQRVRAACSRLATLMRRKNGNGKT